jgi:phosphotransferase family enzyme
MPASKDRLRWEALPEPVRALLEELAGGRVVSATNCAGGYSPGLASQLELADGRQVFAKAISSEDWPMEYQMYIDEARITTRLPAGVSAPRLIGTASYGAYLVLVFEYVAGREPQDPWQPEELERVLEAIGAHPAPDGLPGDFPRLGGWRETYDVPGWDRADLIALEDRGLEVVQGNELVHGDLYPHNILLGADRVYFVDWPHARRGSASLDVIALLSTAAWHGLDPEPYAAKHPLTVRLDPDDLTAILAAHAGFCLKGAGPGPIGEYKQGLGLAALDWLRARS